MNLHCLQCGKPVPQTAGKRAKSYCNNTCRVKYWKKQKEMISSIEKKKPGRPKKVNLTKLADDVAKEAEKRSNPLINAARGCNSNGFNPDEADLAKKATKETDVFMGHTIPKGLKGIDLSIWKAEIKEQNAKK